MKNYNTLILLIAGQSKRFGGKVKKQFKIGRAHV